MFVKIAEREIVLKCGDRFDARCEVDHDVAHHAALPFFGEMRFPRLVIDAYRVIIDTFHAFFARSIAECRSGAWFFVPQAINACKGCCDALDILAFDIAISAFTAAFLGRGARCCLACCLFDINAVDADAFIILLGSAHDIIVEAFATFAVRAA